MTCNLAEKRNYAKFLVSEDFRDFPFLPNALCIIVLLTRRNNLFAQKLFHFRDADDRWTMLLATGLAFSSAASLDP
jgi:hypothetical protein